MFYHFIDPLGRPTDTAGSDHSLHFSKSNKTEQKQYSLLAILWVWPSGSLMTPVLSYFSRRYSQEHTYYYGSQDKYYGHGPTPELPGWDNPDGEQEAVPVHLFQKHVNELHLDQVRLHVNFFYQVAILFQL